MGSQRGIERHEKTKPLPHQVRSSSRLFSSYREIGWNILEFIFHIALIYHNDDYITKYKLDDNTIHIVFTSE